MKIASLTALVCLTNIGTGQADERRFEVFPLPQGLYSDGETCGAAEIKRNSLYNGFGVRGVIGSTCQLEHVTSDGSTYRFSSTCEEGNGRAAHSWKVKSQIQVTGSESFTFDGKGYRLCGKDQSAGTSDYPVHRDIHLPLIAGSYYSKGEKCGALEYWDNPSASSLGGMFGGLAAGGDMCSVEKVRTIGGRVNFSATCIPSRNMKLMTISAPMSISPLTHSTFEFKNKLYSLCKQLNYGGAANN